MDSRDIDAPSTLTLADQIARQIAVKIISGSYAPGESIPEQSIAEIFEVSRGPVREALRILENDGLVTIVPRKGARVTNLSFDEVAELFQIRGVLFGLAARLCAERDGDGHFQTFEGPYRAVQDFRPRASKDSSEYSEIAARLANAVVHECGNQRLRAMLDPLVLQVQRYSQLGLSSVDRQSESIASWHQLLAAIRAHDGSAAELVAREMVRHTGAFAASRLDASGVEYRAKTLRAENKSQFGANRRARG